MYLMYLEREKRVLIALAEEHWRTAGPGVLFGRIDAGLILDEWITLDELTDRRPDRLGAFLSEDAWRWLRSEELDTARVESATAETAPVVFCRRPGRRHHPELEVFAAAATDPIPGEN